MSVDYFLALSDHYKQVKARLNGGPTRRPALVILPPPPAPEPEPAPPAPEPEPPAPALPLAPVFEFTPSAAKQLAREALRPHGLTWDEAMGPRRTLPYTRARKDVYIALRKHGWSLLKIAAFCGRDHTTIMSALHPRKDRKK